MGRKYSNKSVVTTIANVGGISASDTSLIIADTTGYPTTFPFTIRINPGSASEEIVDVNSGLGTVASPYQISRGVDGSTALPWSAGTTVVHGFTARDFSELQDQITLAQNTIATSQQYRVPSGGIIMWSGSAASIPSGWYLCNGNNGTPNLQNRFIVGAGSGFTPGDTGGLAVISKKVYTTLVANNIPAMSHTHSDTFATASDGSHAHSAESRKVDLGTAFNTPVVVGAGTGASIFMNNAGAHTHAMTGGVQSATVGYASPSAVDVTPPFYALCFLMKS